MVENLKRKKKKLKDFCYKKLVVLGGAHRILDAVLRVRRGRGLGSMNSFTAKLVWVLVKSFVVFAQTTAAPPHV